MKIRFIASTLIMLLFCIFLSGCWDSKELENQHYISALGVDYQNEKYVVYIQLISFSRLAKEEQAGKSEENPVWVGKGEGKTINQAVLEIYNSSQERLYWGHTSAFIFGKNLLEKGLGSDLDVILRYREFRYNSWVFGTDCPIEEIFHSPNVLARNRRNNRLHEPQELYKQHSMIAPITLREVMLYNQEPGMLLLLPNINTEESIYFTEKGNINALSLNGGYAIHDGQLKGEFSLAELKGLRWMHKETVRSPIYLTNDGKSEATIVIDGLDPEIHQTIRNGRPLFQISIEGRGRVNEMLVPLSQEELSRKAAESIRNEIRETYEIGLKREVDLLGLSEKLYRRNTRIWKSMQEDEKFWLSEKMLEDIDVKIDIVSSGKYKLSNEAGKG